MPQYCVVPQCTSKWTKHTTLRFHKFPTNDKRKKVWQMRIRSGRSPTVHSKVCSIHFTDEDYVSAEIGTWKFLKDTAVPSQNLPKCSVDKRLAVNNMERGERATKRNMLKENTVFEDQDCVTVQDTLNLDEPIGGTASEEPHGSTLNCKQFVGSSTSTDVNTTEKLTQTLLSYDGNKLLSYLTVSEKMLLYLTGFSKKRFDLFFHLLTDDESLPDSGLIIEDQLVLVLSAYRLNLDFKFLGLLMGVGDKSASTIFNYWTKFIYAKLCNIDFWYLCPPKDNEYRIIIDSTEIPIQRSENPEHHQITFSTYKNRTTFKGLVGIAESGAVIFCSKLYGGGISDRKIFMKSGLLEKLTKGDVLADRGFDISDILEKKKVALNIPPFKRQQQLSEKEVFLTRRIASRRIHIERLFALAKSHKIIQEPMPTHLWPLADFIFFNCIMMCNFKKGIV